MKKRSHHFHKKYFYPIFGLVVFAFIIALGYFISYQSKPTFYSLPSQPGIFQDPQQIDTTIKQITLGKYRYQNSNPVHQTSFRKKPTTDAAVHFANQYVDLSFFTNSIQSFATAATDEAPIIKDSQITYPSIFPNTDLRYTVEPSRLLEEFIIHDQGTALTMTEITQTLDRKKIDSYQEVDGSIELYKNQQLVATIPKPVMYEYGDQSKRSYDLAYRIQKINNNTLSITKVIDQKGMEWLSSSNRQYPIVIDLVIDNADTAASWVSSDTTNTVVSQETTIVQEGTGSVKVATTAESSTTLDLMEYSSMTATGGTIATSSGYTIHTFTSSGTFTPGGVGEAEALVVAGGGGGGGIIGGGGGGGGVVFSPTRITGSAMTVTVGAGGTGGDGWNESTQRGSQGSNSSFGNLVAIGGGGGAPHGGSDVRSATTGGSGGGGGNTVPAGGEGTPGQGEDGGIGDTNDGGGGGGAGAVGEDYGDGGVGIQNSASGSSVYYGGGGGGGGRVSAGTADAGGLGGGGAGTGTTTAATGGTANTGGGGGGAGFDVSSASQMGGDGGTGIVIIRYLTVDGDTESTSYESEITNNTATATGGTITNVGGFRIHTFTSGGTFTPDGSMNVEALIVAGGGGGGGIISGGGGAGGVLYATSSAVTATGYTIAVGSGGTGGVGWNNTPTPGTNGSNSSFNSLTAIGGGGGGGYDQSAGLDGGSGGGGSSTPTNSAGGAGTNGQGNPGGDGGGSSNNGGGGGGAGEAGGSGVNGSYAGDGGDGSSYAISGLPTFYGGGGGGGTRTGNGTAGGGGEGGGGAGTTTTTKATDGTANTGGGGGAGGYDASSASQMGGDGGTGIVIIRYALEQEMPIGGVITDVDDYRLHTFKYRSTDVFTATHDMDVEVLVVGGGGGGGETIAGGGGGGGVVSDSAFAITAGTTYPVIVGAGGAGGTGTGYPAGTKGDDSRFSTILSIGGGAGAGYNVAASGTGGSAGGNGGGGGTRAGYTAGQGNDGGAHFGNGNTSGGGGGAGASGGAATSTVSGSGGDGIANSITGSSVYYGAGGGGGVRNGTGTAGSGGTGGGGAGGSSTVGSDGTDYLGGGGGGGGFVSDLAGGSGGRGIVIIKYLRPVKAFSEATTIAQGSYALRGVAPTTSLNKTLTRTVSPTIDLSDLGKIDFSIRSNRTGSNIKIGIYDSGGTTTEITPNITSADAYQSVEWDISGVSNVNKDDIEQIIITIVDATAKNTFYIDNMVGGGLSLDDTVTLTRSAQDLSESPSLTYWVRSDTTGSFAQFEFGESASSEQTSAFTINSANTWEQKTFDISGITGTDRDAVTEYAFKFTSDTSGAILYFDDINFNDPPTTPTLDVPTDTATNQALLPVLQTTGTDTDGDYLRYKIDVCENVGMTTNCNTHDQTSSQTGWSGQDTQTSTAYTSGTQATYTLQSALSASSTYYWGSYAIDPGGANSWGSTQGTPYSFTTTTAPTAPTTPYAEGSTNPSGVIDLTPEFSAIHNDGDGDSADYYQVEVNTQVGFDGTSMWDSTQTSMTTTANGVRSPEISYAGTSLSLDGTTYYWRIKFWDINGAQGVVSTTANFTMNTAPTTPSLDTPTDTATNQALLPTLRTTGTDTDSDYLRYKIELCEDVGMSVSCQTFDQTSSQTGWSGQDTQTSTAYTSGTQGVYTLQSVLAVSTTYYWRSYAIDPGGANTWSSTQGTPYSFTTTSTPVQHTDCRIQESSDDSSFTIVWTDTATNEDGYEVQRSDDAAAWSVLITGLAANSISHQDSTITTGHTYRYRVAPYLSGPTYGEWCYTNTLSVSEGNFTFENINLK